MRQRTLLGSLVVIAVLSSSSCMDPGIGPDPFGFGGARGLAYIDRNGNGQLDPTVDGPLQGIAVKVVPFGTTTGEVRATTNTLGTFLIQNLKVGDYAVSVDNATVPDSLRVVKIDSARITVAVTDTPTVVVTLSFPTMTARVIRQQLAGKRVFIEGTTLNSWATYGDSTLHIADTSGVLRVTRVVPVNVTSGVRVRVLGTTDARDGQNTLTDASVFVIASAPVPAPTVTTTNIAARADAGKLDAALVQVNSATILGAQTTLAGDFLLTVNDGSGTLEVLIDRNTGIATAPYLPGAILSATGVLVPGGQAGVWQLKPRAVSDLSANFPSATIAEARKLEAGRVISIEATALNSWATFADATVHVNDSTGWLRAVAVPNTSLFTGSRVRLIGSVQFLDGQPVLNTSTVTVLGTGTVPLPEPLTTVNAATADGGKFDAALVRVFSAVVSDTARLATGDYRFRVDDGSGAVEVILDRDSGFQFSPFVPGVRLDVAGVLVPIASTASWRLKPRAQADIVVK